MVDRTKENDMTHQYIMNTNGAITVFVWDNCGKVTYIHTAHDLNMLEMTEAIQDGVDPAVDFDGNEIQCWADMLEYSPGQTLEELVDGVINHVETEVLFASEVSS